MITPRRPPPWTDMTPEVGKFYLTKNGSVVFISARELPCPFTGRKSEHPFPGMKLVILADGSQQSLRYRWGEKGHVASAFTRGLDIVEETAVPENPKNWFTLPKPHTPSKR